MLLLFPNDVCFAHFAQYALQILFSISARQSLLLRDQHELYTHWVVFKLFIIHSLLHLGLIVSDKGYLALRDDEPHHHHNPHPPTVRHLVRLIG